MRAEAELKNEVKIMAIKNGITMMIFWLDM